MKVKNLTDCVNISKRSEAANQPFLYWIEWNNSLSLWVSLKMSPGRIFLNFKNKKKKLLFACFFISYNWSKLCHNVKFPRSLLQEKVTFMTLVLGPSMNIAAIMPCFWSHFAVSVQKKEILDLVSFTNQEQLPWRQIRQSCGLISFSVDRTKRRGYNINILRWYLKTILNSLNWIFT